VRCSIASKRAAETPTYIVASPASEKRGGIQKKHVLIAVSLVVIVGLVIAGIMIGMYMFSETQKEIIKFSMQFKASDNEPATQDVVSDPNDNVVMFHITKPGKDIYVVNDFNKDIQVVKIETSSGTDCYLSALNRSEAADPSKITDAASMSGGGSGNTFAISGTPVSDTSFLTKKARDMCKGVSVYWAYRSCGQQIPTDHNITRTDSLDRNKRTLYSFAPYPGPGQCLPGLGGCCKVMWACRVDIIETVYSNGQHVCDFYYWYGTADCCAQCPSTCWNVYTGTWKTPGLVCP